MCQEVFYSIGRLFQVPALYFLIVWTGLPFAHADAVLSALNEAKLSVHDDGDSKWRLEVRQMPLINVLASIEKKTGIPIHYSALPEGKVTATCVGTTLRPVLECLLNGRADLIVRYGRRLEDLDKANVAEVWILGAKYDDGVKETAVCVAQSELSGSMELERNKHLDMPDQTDGLLIQAKSKSAKDRTEAIGALLSAGRKGDSRVKEALMEALNDPDTDVRAQAISTLAHREGKDASSAVEEAMHDPAADVRMMAVDAITDDVALLQQAINDSDETVRELAAMKLEDLSTRNRDEPK